MKWFGKDARKKSTRARVAALGQKMGDLSRQVQEAKFLAAQALIRDFDRYSAPLPLARAEFKVFSQFGDDGIIQYVLHRLKLPASEHRFVEFGVESYAEANTRFLLLHDNWTGLVMDGSEEWMAALRKDDIYWRHELTAQAHFITRENINALLEEAGFGGRIGLLSIDIDGNDYWVWEALTIADPAVVIVEYNGIFGGKEAVTVPYRADFRRAEAHFSHLYSGASLGALCVLAKRKGYVWIGCNRAGNNAYFVREKDAGLFLPVRLPDDFVQAKFREGRDEANGLTLQGQRAGRSVIGDLPVHDVVRNQTRLIRDLEF
jgi:hypothetical protein